MRISSSLLFLLAAAPFSLSAKVTFNSLFDDHAVLQRGQAVPVWGKADPGEVVKVSYRGQELTATADAQGNWRVELAAMEANAEPADLHANNATCTDVVVGDVWLCSGQSNMVWPLEKSTGGAEAAAAANLPQLRYFLVRKDGPETPPNEVGGAWISCQPGTAGKLSGVAFFFARDLLARDPKVPIGILQSAVSGSQIETWISEKTILSDPALAPVKERWEKGRAEFPEALIRYNAEVEAYRKRKEEAEAAGQTFNEKPVRPPMGPGLVNFPTGHYNGMIAPIATYGIRGAVWYQGEGNSGRGEEYRALMPALIRQWRADWKQGDFPFIIVQLPTHGNTPWTFAKVRDAQALTAKTVPNTFLVVTLDLGEPKNLHPANKEGVGKRVALVARAEVYKDADVKCYGPTVDKVESTGASLRVTFNHADGLTAKGDELLGFEIAGVDQKYVPAEATILEGGRVALNAPTVPEPVAVRYGWNTPVFNLYNNADLPAAPFEVQVK